MSDPVQSSCCEQKENVNTNKLCCSKQGNCLIQGHKVSAKHTWYSFQFWITSIFQNVRVFYFLFFQVQSVKWFDYWDWILSYFIFLWRCVSLWCLSMASTPCLWTTGRSATSFSPAHVPLSWKSWSPLTAKVTNSSHFWHTRKLTTTTTTTTNMDKIVKEYVCPCRYSKIPHLLCPLDCSLRSYRTSQPR